MSTVKVMAREKATGDLVPLTVTREDVGSIVGLTVKDRDDVEIATASVAKALVDAVEVALRPRFLVVEATPAIEAAGYYAVERVS